MTEAARLGAALVHHGLLLLAAALAGLAWIGAGTGIVRWLAPGRFAAPRLAVRLLTGCGIQSLPLLGLALCGVASTPVVLAASLWPLAFPGTVRACREELAAVPWPSAWRLPLAAAAVPLALAALVALAPDFNTDVLSFHLAVPEQMLRVHKLTALDTHLASQFPLTAELHFAVALALRLEALPHLLHLLPFAAGLACLYGWCAARGGPAAGWLAVAGAATSASLYTLMTIAKNDLFAAGFVLGGACALADGRPPARRLGAVLLGFGAATKHSGLVYLTTAVGWIAVAGGLRPALRWLAVAAVPALPWWWKSWLCMGDPVWPLLSAWWPGAVWDPESVAALRAVRGATDLPGLLSMVPKLSITLVRDMPAVAAALPLAGWAIFIRPARHGERADRRPARVLPLVGFAAVSGIAVWFPMPGNGMRYAWEAILLLTGVVAVGAARAVADVRPRTRRMLAWAAVVVSWCSFPRFFSEGVELAPLARYLVGGLTQAQYVGLKTTTLHEVFADLAALPNVHRVFTAGEIRHFRLPGRHLGDRCSGGGLDWAFARESGTAARIATRFRQMGCRHFLHGLIAQGYPHPGAGAFYWDDRMLAVWRTFIGRYTDLRVPPRRVDGRNGGFAIYALRSRPRPADPPWLPYLPGIEGALHEVTRFGATGEVEGWIAAARRLQRRLPDVDAIRDLLAMGLRRRGAWHEAWELYRIGLDHGTVTESNGFDGGLCALQVGELDRAERLFARALEVTPDRRADVEELLRLIAVARVRPK